MASSQKDEIKNSVESANNPNDSSSFRSPQSDVEIPKTRKRVGNDSTDSLANKLDPLVVTKENMSTSRRPADSDFTQQRLFGWQPILTPYNVLPVLFILGLIFVPLGIVFLSASWKIQEVVVDYTSCNYDGKNICTMEFDLKHDIETPVAVYYRLTNFYQNNRLYAMSKSEAQLKGDAVNDPKLLSECAPLDKNIEGKIYYPCGLIANSYFSDVFELENVQKGKVYEISPKSIAWPGDSVLYGKTNYEDVENILPPIAWQTSKIMGVNDNGKYEQFPDLSTNERFQNWMKISGLPTFRKLYGRVNERLEAGKYKLTITGNYDVSSYKGTKSFVVSSTNWAGGKNDSLGVGFIIVGGLLLVLGLIFLIMFMMAPRKVGDVSYLSWYAENSGDPLAAEQFQRNSESNENNESNEH